MTKETRVLIVDDEKVIADLLQAVLSDPEYTGGQEELPKAWCQWLYHKTIHSGGICVSVQDSPRIRQVKSALATPHKAYKVHKFTLDILVS